MTHMKHVINVKEIPQEINQILKSPNEDRNTRDSCTCVSHFIISPKSV